MKNCSGTAKVAAAMSGGVDSSVAAALLKERGYQVTGITMKIWDGEYSPERIRRHGCYGPGEAEDIEDARRVARTLGIDFCVFDLAHEYRREVLDYFYHEYRSGRTPNPCLRCNRTVKFGALLDRARESGLQFDYFATGHYARVEHDRIRHRYLLKKAVDPGKDQSYFLCFLSQEQLAISLFPVGNYTKEEVREMASEFGLAVRDKPESQDFVAGGYASLLGAGKPGPILDKDRNILGEHRGIQLYTIGQRKGLGISAREPLYVTNIDAAENAIIVGNRDELYRDGLTACGLNWIAIEGLDGPVKVRARIRNAHKEADAVVLPLGRDRVSVQFEEPQMAITPGQAVVFYDGDIVIGGGTIESGSVSDW